MVTVPSRLLLEQFAEEIPGFCKVGTGYNDEIDTKSCGFIAVTDSVKLLKKLKFEAIFIDEAHHPLPPGLPHCRDLFKFSATHKDQADFRYSLGDAIEQGVLCDYDLTVPVVTEGHPYICLANLLLSQAGRFRRVLAYCNSVKEAMRFQQVLKVVGLAAWHINGATSRTKRAEVIRDFCAGLQKAVHVLVTVQVLGEGINLPNVDTCMFVEPRSSYVSIIQAIGRVLRPHPSKPLAHIVLPALVVSGTLGDTAPLAPGFSTAFGTTDSRYGGTHLTDNTRQPLASDMAVLPDDVRSGASDVEAQSTFTSVGGQSSQPWDQSDDPALETSACATAMQREANVSADRSSAPMKIPASASNSRPAFDTGTFQACNDVGNLGLGITERGASFESRDEALRAQLHKPSSPLPGQAPAANPLAVGSQIRLPQKHAGPSKHGITADGVRTETSAGDGAATPQSAEGSPGISLQHPRLQEGDRYLRGTPTHSAATETSKRNEILTDACVIKRVAHVARPEVAAALRRPNTLTQNKQKIITKSEAFGSATSDQLDRFLAAISLADSRLTRGDFKQTRSRLWITDCTLSLHASIHRFMRNMQDQLTFILRQQSPFEVRLHALERFEQEHHRLPGQSGRLPGEKRLGVFLKNTASRFKCGSLSAVQIDKLLKTSCSALKERVQKWLDEDRAFNQHVRDLKQFIQAHERLPMVRKKSSPQETALRRWLLYAVRQIRVGAWSPKEQRCQIMAAVDPKLSKWIMSELERPYERDIKEQRWMQKYDALIDLVSSMKRNPRPVYEEERPLYNWLNAQRRHFKFLPPKFRQRLLASAAPIASFLSSCK